MEIKAMRSTDLRELHLQIVSTQQGKTMELMPSYWSRTNPFPAVDDDDDEDRIFIEYHFFDKVARRIEISPSGIENCGVGSWQTRIQTWELDRESFVPIHCIRDIIYNTDGMYGKWIRNPKNWGLHPDNFHREIMGNLIKD
ncbi:MAG: hypothetical protein ACRC78_03135 [Planktothrix sp.]